MKRHVFHQFNNYDLPHVQGGVESSSSAGGADGHKLNQPAAFMQLRISPHHRNAAAAERKGSMLPEGQERAAIPTVPEERVLEQRALGDHAIFRTMEHAKPPLAGSFVDVEDQGISGPNVLRLSMYNVPNSKKLREMSGLPLAVIFRPFCVQNVPLADFSSTREGPPRCSRCRAYVNPSTRFSNGGSQFVCNLCLFVNEVPDYYYQPLDAAGRRIDWKDRPELVAGTYDFALPEKYGKGRPLRLIVVIETTQEAQNKGLPFLVAHAIREAMNIGLAAAEIAFLTFDERVKCYRLFDDAVESLVLPPIKYESMVPPNLFVPTHSKRIEGFLEDLPTFCQDTQASMSCFGEAIDAALSALDGPGRIAVICASRPNIGHGKLIPRDVSAYHITPRARDQMAKHDPEKELFVTVPHYADLGKKCTDAGVVLDLFAFPSGYSDIPSLEGPSRKSGGALFVYPRFISQRDGDAFVGDFVFTECNRMCAVDTSVGIRTSTGLQIETLYGDHIGGSDVACAASIVHDGTLDLALDAHFQAAILYTTTEGERRVRVANTPAGVTDQFNLVIRFIDVDTVVAVIVRQIVQQLPHTPLADLRAGLNAKMDQIFAACRAHAGPSLPPSQLLMPTSLRLLLPMLNALQKSIMLSPRAMSVDQRAHCAATLASASCDKLSLLLYPRVYSLRAVADQGDIVNSGLVRALGSELRNDIYLLFNGELLLLYIPIGAPGADVHELLDVDIEHVNPYMNTLPELDTPLNRRAQTLISRLCDYVQRPWMPLQVARQGIDGAELIVQSMLVEDPQGGESYIQTIRRVHRNAKSPT